jgi:agmatine deiminase
MTLPRAQSDWGAYISEVLTGYSAMLEAISRFEPVVLLCADREATVEWLRMVGLENRPIHPVFIPTNDTWIRDYGPITLLEGQKPLLCDFEFNGWGLKYPANWDNQATEALYQAGVFGETSLKKCGWILEGGSIESDGAGTLLVTATCLLSCNRHPMRDKATIERLLRQDLGGDRVLWLTHGHLENDDTDGHVDTLARFCDPESIAYVACDDPADPHYEALKKMEAELQALRRRDNQPYHLIALPMVDALYYEGERLPATYANFLIINGAVIVPTYGVKSDDQALKILRGAFPERVVVGVDASVLVRQHGSIHCATMQIPREAPLDL